MAYEYGLFDVGNFKAAGNYSSASAQYSVVRLTSAAQFSYNVKSSQASFGILQDRPSSGMAGTIRFLGFSKGQLATAHSAIAVGDKLCASTVGGNGHLIKSTLAGRYVIGRALEACSSNVAAIISLAITHEGAGSTGTAGAA